MNEKNLLWLIGFGVVGYYFYQQSLLAPTVATAVVGLSPTPVNVQQNEFQCPTGTHYFDSGIASSSAGGYCA